MLDNIFKLLSDVNNICKLGFSCMPSRFEVIKKLKKWQWMVQKLFLTRTDRQREL